LFLSTDENVGVELLLAPLEELGEAEELLDAPPEALLGEEELGEAEELELGEEELGEAEELELGEEELGEAEELEPELGEEELEAPPDALPEDLLLSVALGLALEPVPEELVCAAATPASARRAAAVAV
jgi:hypothetical protein